MSASKKRNWDVLSSKLLSQFWMTSDYLEPINFEDQEDSDDEDMVVADTYSEYMPLKLKFGNAHPDSVVETASLSNVEPPDIWYNLCLPMSVILNGSVSALQLEAIVYASQQHEHFLPDGSRAGFLIGDGAGVGKGRTIAGLIYENYIRGRKSAIWISVSNDLKYDAERDLKDVDASHIKVYSLSKLKYNKIKSRANGFICNGVMFSTYAALLGRSSLVKGYFSSRINQLIDWCGPDFDGLIIFDESHRAKNLYPSGNVKPTRTSVVVRELQHKLPKARVVYSSATGASVPRNMAYMTRLGIWGKGTPFPDVASFISAVEKRGVGAMEIVAMDMKLRGIYIARQLSFHGVSFRVEEVPLNKEFICMYNAAVNLWVEVFDAFQEAKKQAPQLKKNKMMWRLFWSAHQRFFRYLCIAAKGRHVVALTNDALKNGKCVVIGLQCTGEAATLERLKNNDRSLHDFVSTPGEVFRAFVEKHFPVPGDCNDNDLPSEIKCESSDEPLSKRRKQFDASLIATKRMISSIESSDSDEISLKSTDSDYYDSDSSISESLSSTTDFSKSGNESSQNSTDSEKSKNAMYVSLKSMKETLLAKVDALHRILPLNTLDFLIHELGGSESVAEMTGRKGRMIQTDNGIQYQTRSYDDSTMEKVNLTEKQKFMDGQKNIAIISEAASSGISLQSDRRVKNQKQRVHITLELPWSADRAVQQFGRTHRSNQVNAPEYIFVVSELAGELRFASTIAKRLENLGALTHGDRRATAAQDFSQFNIDNKYGKLALENVLKTILGYGTPIVPLPDDYEGDFLKDAFSALVRVGLITEDDYLLEGYNITRFLNRILGIEVELQNRIFKFFISTVDKYVSNAKKSGRFDLGILDLGVKDEFIKRVKVCKYIRKHVTGSAPVELHTLHVERGISFEEAIEHSRNLIRDREGFYLSHQERNGKRTPILVESVGECSKSDIKNPLFRLYRPNTGVQSRNMKLLELEKKYKLATIDDVKPHWDGHYESSTNTCSHAFWSGNCKNVTLGLECEVGLRRRTYFVISGSVLSVWPRVESIIASVAVDNFSKMQAVRLQTTDGVKIVGTLIPKICVKPLQDDLSSDSESVEELVF